ncbi:hypothetical protein HPG69_012132 [Diceros bicornis minor]|uniref:Uncharacterized protein n=1 Tax=Diceros bicornis minor TaxID=77932 RepID=A0A7J7EHW1_DICBM|nr:hypothetical protein HPG69_012132 [Diceros bicornis minor]
MTSGCFSKTFEFKLNLDIIPCVSALELLKIVLYDARSTILLLVDTSRAKIKHFHLSGNVAKRRNSTSSSPWQPAFGTLCSPVVALHYLSSILIPPSYSCRFWPGSRQSRFSILTSCDLSPHLYHFMAESSSLMCRSGDGGNSGEFSFYKSALAQPVTTIPSLGESERKTTSLSSSLDTSLDFSKENKKKGVDLGDSLNGGPVSANTSQEQGEALSGHPATVNGTLLPSEQAGSSSVQLPGEFHPVSEAELCCTVEQAEEIIGMEATGFTSGDQLEAFNCIPVDNAVAVECDEQVLGEFEEFSRRIYALNENKKEICLKKRCILVSLTFSGTSNYSFMALGPRARQERRGGSPVPLPVVKDLGLSRSTAAWVSYGAAQLRLLKSLDTRV